jgi:hexosaminidase
MTIEQLGTSFITQVSQMLDKKGIEPAGWSDGMGSADPAQMPKVVQSNSWGGLFTGGVPAAYTQANYGWDIVMSTPETLYLDMPYAADPKERGYDWASRNTDLFKVFSFMPENLPANASIMKNHDGDAATITDPVPLTGKGHITGMQGQLWSEGVRSDRIADYMLYPRVLALAERAWHTAGWEPAYKPGQSYSFGDGQVDSAKLLADWQTFNTHLTPQLAALDREGLTYRLPVPGARITGGVLEANVSYANLTIQYRTQGGHWTRYTAPVDVKGKVDLRTVSPNGKRFSRTVTIEAPKEP